jgi:hypothetical protein
MLPVCALLSVIGASPVAADCTCRALGREYQKGETVCLRNASGQNRLATCGMVLNNSSWEFSSTPCVSSQRATPAKIAANWK